MSFTLVMSHWFGRVIDTSHWPSSLTTAVVGKSQRSVALQWFVFSRAFWSFVALRHVRFRPWTIPSKTLSSPRTPFPSSSKFMRIAVIGCINWLCEKREYSVVIVAQDHLGKARTAIIHQYDPCKMATAVWNHRIVVAAATLSALAWSLLTTLDRATTVRFRRFCFVVSWSCIPAPVQSFSGRTSMQQHPDCGGNHEVFRAITRHNLPICIQSRSQAQAKGEHTTK